MLEAIKGELVRRFHDALPYRLTAAQQRVIAVALHEAPAERVISVRETDDRPVQ